jgi:Flp pilus assembly protein TadG
LNSFCRFAQADSHTAKPSASGSGSARFLLRLADFCQNRTGGISIMYAAVLPAMLGMVGLGVEAGEWYLDKRVLQTQADAAALAGAWEKAFNRTSQITPSATHEAVRNGFSNGAGSTIAVHNPPTSGAYAGDQKAVEVLLTQAYDPMFSALFRNSDVTIAARATADLISSGQACILGLNGVSADTVGNSGNINLQAPNCTIAANSNSNCALDITGSAVVNVQSIWTYGGYCKSGTSTVTYSDAPKEHMWPLTDPYAGTPYTAPNGCNNNNLHINSNGSVNLSPGTYCGGIQVDSNPIVDLAPGTYYMKGGDFTVNGGTVRCSSCTPGGAGVTIIFTTPSNGNTNQIGTLTISGNAAVTLNAPSSGTYKGILFYQDPRAPVLQNGESATINGGSGTVLNGAFYFPNNVVSWSGNTSLASQCTMIVANKVTFSGNAGLSVDDCVNQGVSIAFMQKISLVE